MVGAVGGGLEGGKGEKKRGKWREKRQGKEDKRREKRKGKERKREGRKDEKREVLGGGYDALRISAASKKVSYIVKAIAVASNMAFLSLINSIFHKFRS